jgi:hypothetical protein
MAERPLPRPTKETVYRVGRSLRGGQAPGRPTHVYKVDRIKIGADYQGVPIWTERPDHRAIGCGVFLTTAVRDEGVAPESVSCAKCRRKYVSIATVAQGPFGRRS